jgi:hypothetical protein
MSPTELECVFRLPLAWLRLSSRKAPFSHQAGPLSRVDAFSAPLCSHTFCQWGSIPPTIPWELVGHREMKENVYMSG